MRIGVPKEIKQDEYRVSVLPDGVRALIREGHQVWVENNAGLACGHPDAEYLAAGAKMAGVDSVWKEAELIYKVKEPVAAEYPRLRKDLVVFTYLHLAANKALTDAVLQSGVVALAFESIHDREGRLPCLVPMSEIAGRMAVQEGAKCLEMVAGGRGILLAGVPGVKPGYVAVVGGGVVGMNAARVAAGLGASVTVLDISLPRLRYLNDILPANVTTLYATAESIASSLAKADLVIGAVLKEGAPTPKVITRAMLRGMRPGSAFVDVAIDQGGCSESSHATTHSAPTFIEEGVVHYCVANMPGAVARTSTQALSNATLPYALRIAGLGLRKAFEEDAGLAAGLNAAHGKVLHPEVAKWLGLAPRPWQELLL